MKNRTGSLILVIACLMGQQASAQSVRDASGSWSSFSQFFETLSQVAPNAMVSRSLPDLSTLSTATVLLVEPNCRPEDQEQLKNFVENGGFLALIAERPPAKPCFDAFGLQLKPPLASGPRQLAIQPISIKAGSPFFDNNPGHVLANRPRLLFETDGFEPIITLDDGRPLGYLLRVGKGEIMALSDSSLFINLMLASPPNHRFMIRLARWLKARPGRLVIGQENTMLSAVASSVKPPEQTVSSAPPRRPSRSSFVTLFLACTLAGISLVVLVLSRLAEASTAKPHRATVLPRPTALASKSTRQNINFDEKV